MTEIRLHVEGSIPQEGVDCWWIIDQDGNTVGSVYGHQNAEYPQAVADLIGGADALLAACKAALPIVCSRIEYPGDPCEKIAAGIRAAITKARGRMPG